MLRRTPELDALERRWERHAYAHLGYEESLARFSALWAHARSLAEARGDAATDWQADIAPDLRIARAVNGLPPS